MEVDGDASPAVVTPGKQQALLLAGHPYSRRRRIETIRPDSRGVGNRTLKKDAGKVGAAEVSSGELTPFQIGTAKGGVSQRCQSQVRAFKVSVGENGFSQIGTAQLRSP